MSMEMHVFYRGKLPSKSAISRTMKELGLPLTITSAEKPLERQTGFMPMRWQRHDTGVEFDVCTDRADLDELGAEGVDPQFDRSANFRWGGDFKELLCAQSVAAALAKLTGGVIFEPQEGRLLSLDEAVAGAHSTLALGSAEVEQRRPGNTKADVKRYLKSLLAQRNDLILRGRFLFIRPVRHILRGAYLAPAGPDQLEIWRGVEPLWQSTSGESVSFERVWQPYFRPWLLDVLQQDVFDLVGEVRTFGDLTREILPHGEPLLKTTADALFAMLILGDNRERIEAVVAGTDESKSNPWLTRFRAYLKGDTEEICAEYHAREAERAKALGLGDAWEPTPFPVEVPKSRRHLETSEPSFATSPWPVRPEGLISEAPEHPGEVAFARHWARRKDRIIMVSPLTREEARTKHEKNEPYCLFARLSGGELAVLHRQTGKDPENPDRPTAKEYQPLESYWLWMHSSVRPLLAEFCENYYGDRQELHLHHVDVRTPQWTSAWHSNVNFREDQITTYNEQWRSGTSPEYRPITEVERSICVRSFPDFGEYEDLVMRVDRFLKHMGYGKFLKE